MPAEGHNPIQPEDLPVLTSADVMALLNITERQLRRLIETSRLVCRRGGLRERRFTRRGVDNYIRGTAR